MTCRHQRPECSRPCGLTAGSFIPGFCHIHAYFALFEASPSEKVELEKLRQRHYRRGWGERAACRDFTDSPSFDPENNPFFPNAGGVGAAKAKAICATCEVRSECLAYVFTLPAGTAGVWGGTSFADRQVMRRRLGELPEENAA